MRKCDSLALEVEIAYRSAAESLLDQAKTTVAWALQLREKKIFEVKQRQQLEELKRLDKSLRLANWWNLLQDSQEMEQLVIATVLRPTRHPSPRYWKVDSSEDKFGRRWILKMDMKGIRPLLLLDLFMYISLRCMLFSRSKRTKNRSSIGSDAWFLRFVALGGRYISPR